MNKQIGLKADHNKPLIVKGLLEQFPKAIVQVARASEYGAKKYAWGNWRFVESAEERYKEALLRHFIEPGFDEESKLLHLAHTAWNALALLELALSEENK